MNSLKKSLFSVFTLAFLSLNFLHANENSDVTVVFANEPLDTFIDSNLAIAQMQENNDNRNYEIIYNFSSELENLKNQFLSKLQDNFGEEYTNYIQTFLALLHNNHIQSEENNQSTSQVFNQIRELNLAKRLELARNTQPNNLSNEQNMRVYTLSLEGQKILLIGDKLGSNYVNNIYTNLMRSLGESFTRQAKVVFLNSLLRTNNYDYTNLVDANDYVVRMYNQNNLAMPSNSTMIENANNGILNHQEFSNTMRNQISQAIAPEVHAQNGIFTATLTWDGSGDVDLHVYEPDNNKVFWMFKRGNSGYLDYDNVVAYGPEHYYIYGLDQNNPQEGIYKVGIANFSEAQGRTATVQISSYRGVLGTKSVTLGQETDMRTGYYLFNVKLSKNSQGKFVVTLVN